MLFFAFGGLMKDHIADFLTAMRAAGIPPAKPSDIIANDKRNRYQVEGDKPSKRNGEYKLKIKTDGQFAFGYFKDYSQGVTHSWHSDPDREFTPAEKSDWQKARDEQQEQQEIEDAERARQAAKRAKERWDGAKAADPNHPYLVRKGIKPYILRQEEDNLLVPLYRHQRIAGLQIITPEGVKKYSFGMSVKGASTVFGERGEGMERILICEGFATGASLREATGLPVVCAMDKANLFAVAEYYRGKYPAAQLIFCEDSDQWRFGQDQKPDGVDRNDYPGDAPEWNQWREERRLENIGHEKAREAAGAFKGFIIAPGFPADDKEKRTDFNDLHLAKGLDAVADRIKHVKKVEPPPTAVKKKSRALEIPHEDWHKRLLVKAEGKGWTKLHENSFNYSLITRMHTRLKDCFAWDEFHHCIMVIKCLPTMEDEGRLDKFKVHRIDDRDVREVDYFIQNAGWDLSGSMDKTRAAIEDCAIRNPIHPARDYFDSMRWDGKPRLDTWLQKYIGAEKDDERYVRAVGRAWLIAAVRRVYEPGSKFDHMLIFEGPQGAGKSTALKILATFGDNGSERSYFTDTLKISNCEDPDELMKLTGKLIVEIQEMSGFSKKDDDALKAFITTTDDLYRMPYGRDVREYPRQFVLAGTYNPVDGIFKDPTGLRRFWVVSTGSNIDLQGLRRDRYQLWAEAVTRYKAGESTVLSYEISNKAEEAAAHRRIIDDMEKDVLDCVAGMRFFETRDVLRKLGIPNKGKSQSESRTINKILMINGFQRVSKRAGSRTLRSWEPPLHAMNEPLETPDIYEEEISF